MTIFDRYLAILFFKILVICFFSFAGLFVVIHVFTNLDEVGAIVDQPGGFEKIFFEYYGPQVMDLFNRMSGILILISAIFSVSLMQRRREFATAIEAAGVTKARVVRPVIFASIFIVGFAGGEPRNLDTKNQTQIGSYAAELDRGWCRTDDVSKRRENRHVDSRQTA